MAVAEVLRLPVKSPLAREVAARLVITRRMAMPGVFSLLREPGVDLRTAAAVLAVRDRVD